MFSVNFNFFISKNNNNKINNKIIQKLKQFLYTSIYYLI